MDIWYILMTPFTWLLKFFYGIFHSYGIAVILFSLVIKVVLFPLSLKGKRGMIQMNMMQEKVNKLQKQYANNPHLANQKVQELYAKEGVTPMGGCLWSMLPILLLFPLYAVVRRPLKYWLGLTAAQITGVTEAVTAAGLDLGPSPEITTFSAFYKDVSILNVAKAAVPDANLYGINFSFLGIDLSATPTWKFWENGLNWPSIGLFLIPVLVVVTSFVSSQIMMKTNNQVSNTENSQAARQNRMMQWLSPIMMVYFSFIMPAAMGIYITTNSVFSTLQEVLCARLLKADYEKAAEAARQRELQEKEEEKRLRRERAEQKAREAEEARKNKGKKKEKTGDDSKMTPGQREASRVGIRQYARGRSYDPDRYGGVTPYHDGQATIETTADKPTGTQAIAQAEQESAGAAAQVGPDPKDTAAPVEENTSADSIKD